MDEVNEEVYSTIFNALRHGVRRNILRMLSKQELAFTVMEETLRLSSSHLTYHLDALKELVTKTENGYKLSVFGQAAVEMIEKVETPPQEHQKRSLKYKQISTTLIAITLITLTLFGYSQIQLNKLKSEQTNQINQINTMTEKLEQYESIKTQLQTRPETHFSTGVIAVIGWTVEYKQDFSKEIWYEDNQYPPYFYAFFYAPCDDLTLILEPGKYVTPDDFAYPLTIQKGNAWWNESGVKQVEYFGEVEQVSWMSPIIWQQNVSRTDIIEIPLDERGWYTLCMTGPIKTRKESGVSMKIGVPPRMEGDVPYPQYANTWIDFKLLKDGEAVLFNIWSRGG
jgi:hypothetical protein